MHHIAQFLHLQPARPHPPLDTQLIGPRVLLRMADSENWRAWRTLREASRDFLVPWEPLWPSNALSYGFFCSLLRRQWRDWRSGKGFAFTIFTHGGPKPELIGGITLGDVRYAAAQKGTIGYWIGQPYAGQGLMTEAVDLVCTFAFETLYLQRVEASCLPRNDASKALLTRMGFEQEGYAKAYLQINGKREDHLLWGKPNPAVKQTAPVSV
jgi:ribosomal-protein-alanine N-acetyltransferase